jgi:site-specific DNA-methyltransferase (adenine-specific)
MRAVQVNTSWKPILIYSHFNNYPGKIFGDVFKSPAPAKVAHDWEQSEGGMLSIIQQICLPGESIFDPFLGSGTTGVAALKHGCTFAGIDIDEQCVNISKGRLAAVDDQTTV